MQGLTEFLPVSSSGHLILGSAVLGLPAPGLSFSVMVHLGTAFATIVMLWREIAWLVKGVFAPDRRSDRGRAIGAILLIVVASIPGGLLGVFGGDFIEQAFSSLTVAAVGLIITGFVLALSVRAGRSARRGYSGHKPSAGSSGAKVLGTVNFGRAVNVGLAQAVAVIPGISRSGLTIATGLLSGMSREDSARFSFLLALPAVFGGALLDYRKAASAGTSLFSTQAATGALVAFVAGVFALAVVFRLVRRGELSKFAYYCWAAGGITLVWTLIKR